jgi:hypothetical protein
VALTSVEVVRVAVPLDMVLVGLTVVVMVVVLLITEWQ